MKYILIALFSLGLSGCYEISKGVKVGRIVKCVNQGIIFKTFECELIRGGLNNSSGSFGAAWDFTVEDEETKLTALKALENNIPVEVHFHQELLTAFRTQVPDRVFVDKIVLKGD